MVADITAIILLQNQLFWLALIGLNCRTTHEKNPDNFTSSSGFFACSFVLMHDVKARMNGKAVLHRVFAQK